MPPVVPPGRQVFQHCFQCMPDTNSVGKPSRFLLRINAHAHIGSCRQHQSRTDNVYACMLFIKLEKIKYSIRAVFLKWGYTRVPLGVILQNSHLKICHE